VPRKLKTYQTSIGFFDLAVAAPSMKAALQAWGANSNLFHQGVAKQVDDPPVVAATMAKPGVVLRRPVGSSTAFKEHAGLPANLPGKAKPRKPAAKPSKKLYRNIDDNESRRAAVAFEKEQRRRERQRVKEGAREARKRERRDNAVAKAEAALANARREHEKKANTIEAERAALEKRWQAEEARWEKQKQKLMSAFRRAQD
jgi:colicin import membrane protein